MRAGIPVAGSSDAPYAAIDPWAAMRAATARRTAAGRAIGAAEAIGAAQALGLYLGAFDDPGRAPRRIVVGMAADLCLLDAPLADVLASLSAERVRATFIDGACVFDRHAPG